MPHTLSVKSWLEQTDFGWQGRVMSPTGRTRSKTFSTQREAKGWIRRTLTEITDGSFVPEASGKISLSERADRWKKTTVDLAAGTRNRRASDLKNWIVPEFGNRPTGAITQFEVKSWIARMTAEGRNAGSIKLSYETLATVLRAAVDAELIKRSPCYRVGLPRYERSEMKMLTITEIVRLSNAINPRYKARVLLAGTGGLRIGELGALRGRRIDSRRGTVDIVENLVLDNGHPTISTGKTKASRRKVPLPRPDDRSARRAPRDVPNRTRRLCVHIRRRPRVTGLPVPTPLLPSSS